MSSVRKALPLRVTLIDPDGTELVVTEKVARLRSLTLALEDDLTSLVHGDISLDILDADGEVEAFLDLFSPREEWSARIERENEQGELDLIFGGVLDLPNGVSYNRGENTVDLQVFGYSKILERTSAESVKRTLTGRTGTGTAASASLTMSSTTDVSPGDRFTIGDTSNEEDVVVKSVDSATAVTLTAVLENSYTAAEMTPLTPYYRNKTLSYLAGQLLTTAGLSDYDVDLAQSAAMAPSAGSANDTNLPAASGLSIVPNGTNIRVISNSRYYEQTDPTSSFVDTGAATAGQADWTPYKTTEPGTIRSYNTGGTDQGGVAIDYDSGERWRTNRSTTGGLPPTDSTLSLQKNESNQTTLDTDTGAIFWDSSVEYDPDNNECWVAWNRTDDTVYSLDTWNGSTITNYVTGYIVDGLRFVKALNRMLVYRSDTDKIEFHTLGAGKAKDFEVSVPEGFRPWTFRVWDDKWAAGLYVSAQRLYVRVWKIADWSVVLDQRLQDFSNSNRFATIYTDDDGAQHYLILGYYYTGSVYYQDYFIVSTELFGVIPYANFTGMSCAKAFRECCVVTGAVFRVNPDRTVNVRARGSIPSESVLTLPDSPLEWTSRPVWEWYRASVGVQGKTEDGTDIDEVYGETGDSTNRLDVDSKLITNLAIASSVGTGYLSYLSETREQEDAEFVEEGTIPAPLDRVDFNGGSYQVLETSVDFSRRTMSLRMVRV